MYVKQEIEWNLRIMNTFGTTDFVYREVVLSLEVKMY